MSSKKAITPVGGTNSTTSLEGVAPPGLRSRRILHCDMDCFYAAVHMRDDPSLCGKPVVIGGSPTGRGVIAAASYEARRLGLHSAMPASRAVRRCPDAIFIRPDFPRYRDESRAIFDIFRRFTPLVQPASLDEAYLDVTEHLDPLGSATAIAHELRRVVAEERRLTVSVGVGPNKLIAKIASDHDKPDGLTVVRPDGVLDFLAPLAVRRLLGVGPATQGRLERLGVRTIAELRDLGIAVLTRHFGSHGQGLYNSARGIDRRPVRIDRTRKSLGHERTYSRDLRGLEEMDEQIAMLGAKVAADLERRELAGRTISAKIRYGDFTTLTRARTLSYRIRDAATIVATAKELLRSTEAGQRSVRLLGVTVSGFVPRGAEQLWLFPDEDRGVAGEQTSRSPA